MCVLDGVGSPHIDTFRDDPFGGYFCLGDVPGGHRRGPRFQVKQDDQLAVEEDVATVRKRTLGCNGLQQHLCDQAELVQLCGNVSSPSGRDISTYTKSEIRYRRPKTAPPDLRPGGFGKIVLRDTGSRLYRDRPAGVSPDSIRVAARFVHRHTQQPSAPFRPSRRVPGMGRTIGQQTSLLPGAGRDYLCLS